MTTVYYGVGRCKSLTDLGLSILATKVAFLDNPTLHQRLTLPVLGGAAMGGAFGALDILGRKPEDMSRAEYVGGRALRDAILAPVLTNAAYTGHAAGKRLAEKLNARYYHKPLYAGGGSILATLGADSAMSNTFLPALDKKLFNIEQEPTTP